MLPHFTSNTHGPTGKYYNEPMSAQSDASARQLVAHLQRVFGSRLLSVVAYGQTLDQQAPSPLTSFVLVAGLSQDDLDACSRAAAQWARAGIQTPLILPEAEFRRSLDTFPLEYADILASHVRLFGRDPFDGVVIEPDDLRRACERQVKSHLLHLREGYIEAQADPRSVAQLVAGSSPAFAALLRNFSRLHGVAAQTRHEGALAGARASGLDEMIVREVLSLDDGSARTADGARLFPAYLAAVERLAHAVDTWSI
jgi:hypothetical protein